MDRASRPSRFKVHAPPQSVFMKGRQSATAALPGLKPSAMLGLPARQGVHLHLAMEHICFNDSAHMMPLADRSAQEHAPRSFCCNVKPI